MSDSVNGLPPLDVRDNRMLPTVVRRDVRYSPAIAGNRSVRARSDEPTVSLKDQVSGQAYARFQHHSTPVVKSGSHPKGLIIDVWA
jgi:hypothetical protein